MLLSYLWIFLIAIAASTVSALVGLGGGILMIPFLILIFGLPVKYVAGTMLFAMVPYTIVATARNLKQGYVNFKIGLIMESGSVIGVFSGAQFSTILPDIALKILFISVVLYLMLTLQIPNDSPYNYVARIFKRLNHIPPKIDCTSSSGVKRLSVPALMIIGFAAGIFSGLLGIGGGFLKTPVLIVGVMLAPKIAVATALFMILITATFGTITHAFLGHIYYPLAMTVAGGMMIGAYFGTSIFKVIPDRKVKQYIFIAMIIAGVFTFFR